MPLSFDDLIEEIEKDNKIDQLNLEGELNRCLSLTTKYLRYHRQYKELLINMWGFRDKTLLEKQEYYSGRAHSSVYKQQPFNIEVKNSTEMKRWIEGDPVLVEMDAKIKLTEDCLEKVQIMIDSLKYRPNHIQTILDIRKFESGA